MTANATNQPIDSDVDDPWATTPAPEPTPRAAMIACAEVSGEYQAVAAHFADLARRITALGNRTYPDTDLGEPARPQLLESDPARRHHDRALQNLDQVALYLHARAGAWDAEANRYEAEAGR